MSIRRWLWKFRLVIVAIMVVALVVLGAIFYYAKFYRENINHRLPLSMTLQPQITEETIASQLFETYLQPYRNLNSNPWGKITSFTFDKVQVLAGTPKEFAAGVTFGVQLNKGQWSTHHSWGTVQKNGWIKNIHWTLRIKKTGANHYTLEQIDTTEQAIAGLPPVKNQYQKQAGIPVPDNTHRYQIANDELQVTYNGGAHWITVPISVDDLFQGDYSGSKDTLISGSYMVTPARTAFVVYDGPIVSVLQSDSEGKTWTTSVVGDFQALRLRFIGFTSKSNGYLILSGGRVMSQEGTEVYQTTDGGKTWKLMGSVTATTRLLTAGGFVSRRVGFMSFGSTGAPPHPALYRTGDGGKTWTPVDVPIPPQYQGVFTQAEVPTFDGQQGTMLVNQGPEGDYEGGKVMARFISLNGGKTWAFANLVDPDNVLSK